MDEAVRWGGNALFEAPAVQMDADKLFVFICVCL
jgi:hypothetical protein